MAYKINADKCIGCTACARQCPVKAISGERQQTHVIDPEYCINCGLCAQFCAQSAIINQWGAPVKFDKDARKQRKVPDRLLDVCGRVSQICASHFGTSVPRRYPYPCGAV